MAEGLEAIAGDWARDLISKFTNNRYAGVVTGTVAIIVTLASQGLISLPAGMALCWVLKLALVLTH